MLLHRMPVGWAFASLSALELTLNQMHCAGKSRSSARMNIQEPPAARLSRAGRAGVDHTIGQ